MVMVVVVVLGMGPANNGSWDIPADINIFVMSCNQVTMVVTVGRRILSFNSAYLLHHSRHRGSSFCVSCTTKR